MRRSHEVEQLANDFWIGTGVSDLFPRNIEKAVAIKLPAAVVKLPQLRAKGIRYWLQARSLSAPLPMDPRELMGCIVAYRGHAIIFVCGSDSPDEQRITIAHEVAHFIRDYLLPRQRAIELFGESIIQVLDGDRLATPVERVHAVLAHARIGAHVHLLPKGDWDEDAHPRVSRSEGQADALALELVAPMVCVSGLAHQWKNEAPQQLGAALAQHFGVPSSAFNPILSKLYERPGASFFEDMLAGIRSGRP
jgi:hypothetical protein